VRGAGATDRAANDTNATINTNQHESRASAIRVIRLVAPSRTLAHVVGVIPDPHAALRDRVFESVLQGAGETDTPLRSAAAKGSGVPADLQPLVDKIHRHAYKVTDEDLARLQPKYADDQLFEIIVNAALGASRHRLLAGLEALDEA